MPKSYSDLAAKQDWKFQSLATGSELIHGFVFEKVIVLKTRQQSECKEALQTVESISVIILM